MIRNRIVELRHVPAAQLLPNPKNWRMHPAAQREALAGILEEVGYVDALLARTLPDGTLELIDGHLRADLTPDCNVPVLVVDLNEAEAHKILATFDPLAAMAETNQELLAELVDRVETSNPAVANLLSDLTVQSSDERTPDVRPQELAPLWQVIVDCESEDAQRAVFEQLEREGQKCRLLTLY